MTGESQRDDHDDFLDDDFVIEDIAPKNDDLDRLFETQPGHGKPPVAGDPDAEDVLFAEPEAVTEPSATFEGRGQFAENSDGGWEGGALDLEAEAGHTAATPADAMAAAEASFTQELDSLLQSDEDFALDSEQELEVIGGATGSESDADGISEFEQSGPFVLDDGEGLWQDEAARRDTEDEGADVPLHAAVEGDEAETHEPGWEPLPSTHVDDLAEVDEVARAEEDAEADPVYGESFEDGAEHDLVGVAAEAEGHDIYAQEEPDHEVVGATERGGRTFRVLLSVAATLTVLAAGALVVLRPEWVGLRLTPERVEQAQVTRPAVSVDVPAPLAVVTPEPPPVEPPPVEAPPVEPPSPVEPPNPVVVVTEPPPVAEPAPVVEPPVTEPVAQDPPPSEPTDPTLPVVPAPTPDLPGWPTPVAVAEPPLGPDGRPRQNLVRVNEELMIGEPEPVAERSGGPEGMLPGSRAFAQLQNGNFFIGNVKAADPQRITLRVDNGEVTLPIAAIARLTELGSTDYEDLQKVTSGFVRLTNNNRLVGGILSGIADDHVVLEFRKNRVMLPRSLVGQVVSGDGDAGIRLDTTREEDDWLRRLVERELGTGTGAEPPAAPQGTQPPR